MGGIEMEWIKAILTKYTNEEGVLDVESAEKEIRQEFPNHAVPKDKYNNVSDSLKEAKATIETLEAKTKDNPEVQKELETYKSKAEKLEAENKQLIIDQQVNEALREAGAVDLEYARFKLGELELDKKNQIPNLENKIKDLQSNLPDYFKSIEEENDDTQPPKGFEVVDNDLKGGKQSDPDPVQSMIDAFTSDLPAPPQ